MDGDRTALFRPEAGSKSLQPVLFHRYEEISPRAKLLLAFRAALVGAATGVMPTFGQIVHGKHFDATRLNLSPLIKKVQAVANSLRCAPAKTRHRLTSSHQRQEKARLHYDHNANKEADVH